MAIVNENEVFIRFELLLNGHNDFFDLKSMDACKEELFPVRTAFLSLFFKTRGFFIYLEDATMLYVPEACRYILADQKFHYNGIHRSANNAQRPVVVVLFLAVVQENDVQNPLRYELSLIHRWPIAEASQSKIRSLPRHEDHAGP